MYHRYFIVVETIIVPLNIVIIYIWIDGITTRVSASKLVSSQSTSRAREAVTTRVSVGKLVSSQSPREVRKPKKVP